VIKVLTVEVILNLNLKFGQESVSSVETVQFEFNVEINRGSRKNAPESMPIKVLEVLTLSEEYLKTHLTMQENAVDRKNCC